MYKNLRTTSLGQNLLVLIKRKRVVIFTLEVNYGKFLECKLGGVYMIPE